MLKPKVIRQGRSPLTKLNDGSLEENVERSSKFGLNGACVAAVFPISAVRVTYGVVMGLT